MIAVWKRFFRICLSLCHAKGWQLSCIFPVGVHPYHIDYVPSRHPRAFACDVLLAVTFLFAPFLPRFLRHASTSAHTDVLLDDTWDIPLILGIPMLISSSACSPAVRCVPRVHQGAILLGKCRFGESNGKENGE